MIAIAVTADHRKNRFSSRLCGLWSGVVLAFASTLVSYASAIDPSVGLEGLDAKVIPGSGTSDQAISAYRSVIERSASRTDSKAQIDASLTLGGVYQSRGHLKPALGVLTQALALAQQGERTLEIAACNNALGSVYTLLGLEDMAESCLNEALASVRVSESSALLARVHNNFGNLRQVQSKYEEALTEYAASRDLATRGGDTILAAKALANAAQAAMPLKRTTEIESFNSRAKAALNDLPPSEEKAMLLTMIGQNFATLAAQESRSRKRILLLAHEALDSALSISERLGDNRTKSYALGFLAQLYEADDRLDDALLLTRRAAFSGQLADVPEAVYRWHWHTGRLLARLSQKDGAIAAYRRAIDTLQGIRSELSLGHGNQAGHKTFRQASGELYFELADLLLQQVETEGDTARIQDRLVEARETIELLRSAEIEDYFQDECVSVVRSRTRRLEAVSPGTAIIYVIPLRDRLELLLSVAHGFVRIKVAVGDAELNAMANQLRRQVEKRTTFEFLEPAQQLYRWLIAPIRPALESRHVDTLVFVPDGAMRMVPMGVLHDGENFLANKYAVAITPGLTLMDPRPLKRRGASLLIAGLSEAVQGFSPLEYVPDEVASVRTNYVAKVLLDRDYSLARMEDELGQGHYSVVHIASHAEFDSDFRKSFLLAYDKRLTLDDLDRLIRPSQFRGQPVELLTLSACQTAAGDDRAALGLAGIAIKSGARSALATLWFVNDQASAALVGEFYSQMRHNPGVSKAKALQAAQIRLLQDVRYNHPCYWSPYLIIGNWL